MRLLLALLIAAAPVSALAKDRPDTTASSPEAVAQVTPDPTIIGTPPALPPVDFQVVRLGDSNLSCEALMTEINTLSAQASAGINFDYSAMMPKGSMMGGAGLAPGAKVEVTARIALGGQPTASTGDPFGQTGYDVGRDGEKDLVIDRLTP